MNPFWYMNNVVENVGSYLVNLYLSTKENMTIIINEVTEQINTEKDNDREFRASNYVKKMILMVKIK